MEPSRIDVAFFGVRALHLREEYASLRIEEEAEMAVDGILSLDSHQNEALKRYLIMARR